jgi:hypothetical protein
MKPLAGMLLLVSLASAQSQPSLAGRIEWNPSAQGASKRLPDGRVQKTVASKLTTVSAIAAVINARRFLDPPMEGGPNVAYIAIGIKNTSKDVIHIEPSSISLRVLGKENKALKRLTEEDVVFRAWYGNDRVGGAVPPMDRDAGNDGNRDLAVVHKELDRSNRRMQEVTEQQSTAQANRVKDISLLTHDLDPGKATMGMVFFFPYEPKDKVELSVLVGDTTFVIPFSGRKARR